MMPLNFANIGEENTVKRIGGSDEVRHHLENLGFTVGARVTVISSLSGSIIVSVKDSRIGIGKDMASKIMI